MSWKTGIYITFWKLWQCRNLRIFENEHITALSLVHQIVATAKHTETSFVLLHRCM